MPTPTPPLRERILEAFKARLETIRIADGCFTDAGAAIFLGEAPSLSNKGDPAEAIAIAIGEDVPAETQMANVLSDLSIECLALVKASRDLPWRAAERVLADLKRAIEIDLSEASLRLDGLLAEDLKRGPTRSLEREEGGTTVGLSITYRLTYLEAWGNP